MYSLSIDMLIFLSFSLKIFFFISVFLNFDYGIPRCFFGGWGWGWGKGCFILFSFLVFSELPRCDLVSQITLGTFTTIIVSNIASFCVFSFWYSHYTYIIYTIVVPQFLDILFHFFPFQFWQFLLSHAQIQRFFPQPCPGY